MLVGGTPAFLHLRHFDATTADETDNHNKRCDTRKDDQNFENDYHDDVSGVRFRTTRRLDVLVFYNKIALHAVKNYDLYRNCRMVSFKVIIMQAIKLVLNLTDMHGFGILTDGGIGDLEASVSCVF